MKNNVRRILRIFFALCAMFCVMLCIDTPVCAMTPNEESDFAYYDYGENRVVLAAYMGTSSKVVVPETLGGKTVYAVVDEAFSGNSNIEEVYLPDTVECFGPDVFYDCANLRTVYLGSLREYLDPAQKFGWMLHKCPNLERIEMSDDANFPIRKNGKNSFEYFYTDLLEHVKYIYIGNSMTDVDEALFYGSGLEYVEIGTGNPVYRSENGVVYSADGKTLLVCGTSYQNTYYEIPEGTEVISAVGFSYCTNIQKIQIPLSVMTISVESFMEIQPKPVLEVRKNSFADAWAKKNGYTTEYYGLPLEESEKINISSSMVKLSQTSYVYDGSEKKPEVSVDSLTEGTDYTVSYQNNIQPGIADVIITGINSYTGSITLQFTIMKDSTSTDNTNGMTNPTAPGETELTDDTSGAIYKVIKPGSTVAYAGSTDKMAKSVKIPSTVTINNTIYRVTTIAAFAFKNNKSLQTVTIQGNVKEIENGAFSGCAALKNVKSGSKVTTIGDEAFYGCKKLTSITIGKNVSSIGKAAFRNCVALKKLIIPANVNKIGNKAFYNCKKLNKITIKTKKLTAKTVGSKAFTKAGSSNYKKLKVNVPSGRYKLYKKILMKRGLSTKAKIKKN